MPALSHLVKRGDAFSFPMAVPRRIASRIQRREVKVSLRTSDPLAAKVRSRLLSNAFDVMFKGLEAMPEVTTETIRQRIKGYFQGCLNRSLEHSQLLPGDPAVDMEQEVAYLRTSVEQMRRQIAAPRQVQEKRQARR